MIAEPPVDVGAVNAIDAVPLPGVAVPIVGAPGIEACELVGVTETVPDAAPVPTLFVAFTEQV